MPPASLRVIITASAEADLFAIERYWHGQGEPWRGDKYFADLTDFAESELCDAARASRGRRFKSRRHANAHEMLAFGVYRVIYKIDLKASRVRVLRFWHSHRDAPPLD